MLKFKGFLGLSILFDEFIFKLLSLFAGNPSVSCNVAGMSDSFDITSTACAGQNSVVTSKWVVFRCTELESIEAHSFDSQAEAENACRTLIRMASEPREYWYEVGEIITMETSEPVTARLTITNENMTTKLELPRQIEIPTADLWLSTGAVTITDIGEENTYYENEFGHLFYCKNYPSHDCQAQFYV